MVPPRVPQRFLEIRFVPPATRSNDVTVTRHQQENAVRQNRQCSTVRATLRVAGVVLCLAVTVPAQSGVGATTHFRNLLPTAFEQNQGQARADVRYIARSGRSIVLLTEHGAYVRLCDHTAEASANDTGHRIKAPTRRNDAQARRADPVERCRTIAMTFAGTLGAQALHGTGKLSGVSNYYIGSDPSRWLSGVPHFASVRYESLYPGVDAVFYHRDGLLEYDLSLDADADVDAIGLRFDGADSIATDTAGNLVIGVDGKQIRLRKPVVYQDGTGGRRHIDASYTVDGNDVRFVLAAYDHNRQLVIDPVLDYSTFAGGSQSDDAFGLAVDAAGNAYIAGRSDSTDFPLAPGATANTSGNGFVIKLNSSGSALIYSTFLGGTRYDDLYDVVIDSQGRAYAIGSTASTDLPVTSGVVQSELGGGIVPPKSGTGDAWIAGLNPLGALTFMTYLGGSDDDSGNGIAIDSSRNIYVTGMTMSTNFPVGGTGFQASNRGQSDGFVVKLNPSATTIVYGGYLGGAGNDWATDIDVDGNGRVAVTGETRSTDFPTTTGAISPVCGCNQVGGSDAFVTVINAAGVDYVYSTYLGGTTNENQLLGDGAVHVDDSGGVFISGSTNSADFPVTSGVVQPSQSGVGFDAFVTKINPDAAPGSNLVFSTYLGGLGTEGAGAISTDRGGNVYVAGCTTSTDFPVKNAIQATHADTSQGSNCDIFVTVLNPTATQQLFSTYLGGWSEESAEDLALDPANNIYITGWTRSVEITGGPFLPGFPVTPGVLQTSFASTFLFSPDAIASRISAVVTTSTTTTTTTTTTTSTSTTTTLPAQSCGDPVAITIGSDRAGLKTASDALFILRTAVGFESCPLCVCDVNNDGKITATDALAALKAAVGQPVSLTCPAC